MPRLEEWEIKKYWEIFQGLKPENNKLTGEKVSPVLKNSRLQDAQLSQIWELSDIDNDGKLDFEEFCITMRMIFDLVNGSITSIPSELPGWLVPGSKVHLIQANRAVNGNTSVDPSFNDDDGEDGLSDDFDWYISPTDKSTYEAIYNSNSDSYGRVRFDSLDSLYKTLSKVPSSDISSAWNLVNPKSFETIDKDQVLVFLHILNQRENGKRVPRGVPASLRATFSKEVPNYDLSANSNYKSGNSGPRYTEPSGTKKFASNYLTKIGQATNEKGTDFSATEGTDWEEVRLRRELTELENLLEKVEKGSKYYEEEDQKNSLVKYELEQLLKYKEGLLNKSKSRGNDKDLDDVKNDIELIESQVSTLEEFLTQKNQELAQIQEEIGSLKA
ncbi:uncharacterized protein CANTADRAFT_333545 [Suhomyces tanzawaensis NRRL Y-17324]|uniref:Actin cytoskeleton-regulatory complex protein END3 n=1 Tax=Suhomyces tanzawaensis NRRL Y-17324 TaxID=984487 RepID=A0A1E4SB85_9ASCO|nr:uncharacterized protein CANTADRAFT_333545 [Suhomyces tanzawaensis NRRL Y-17324]ODV76787.1 hypothetical protein CANTADRAFT_333545 [Suhomyces tanzawaensis NRRL Y-17324]